MGPLYVIYALGKDKQGLVHSVTNILARLGINIVDVEARAVRGHFLLFIGVYVIQLQASFEIIGKK